MFNAAWFAGQKFSSLPYFNSETVEEDDDGRTLLEWEIGNRIEARCSLVAFAFHDLRELFDRRWPSKKLSQGGPASP